MPSIRQNRQALQNAIAAGNIAPAPSLPPMPPIPPLAPYPAAPNAYLRTPLPAIAVQQPDTQRLWQTPTMPQARISPLSATGNPIAGAQAASITTLIVNEAIAAIPRSSGGSINGTTTSPFVPYTSAPNTLSDSTWEFTPSGNVLSNAQSSSTIDMIGAGGNEVTLANNGAGSFPTYLSMDDSDGGSVFLALRPSTHEASFSLSDSAGDGFSFNAENGFGMNCQWIAASFFDNVILDVRTNNELFQMESGLGGLTIWNLDTDGSSDWEQVDAGGSFAEIFQDGSGVTSYFQLEDAAAANVFQVDINKAGAGTVAVTLTSPKPSIALGGATSPTIFAGSGAPTSTPANGSVYYNLTGSRALDTLMYVYDSATTTWVPVGALTPYDVQIFNAGVGSNAQELLYMIPPHAVKIPAGTTGSTAKAKAAAMANTTFTFLKNGVSFATCLFSAGGTSGAFTQASDATFNGTSDILEVQGPATADATLASFGFVLQAIKTA